VTPTPEAVHQVSQLMIDHIVASAVNIAAQLGIAGPRRPDPLVVKRRRGEAAAVNG
jgi:hypothetical protein